MIALLFLLLPIFFAAPPTLIPSPPAEKKILGANQYGAETFDIVEGFGLVRLNGTKVTESLRVTGSLISNNAQIYSLEVLGEANLTDTVVQNGGVIAGYTQAHKSDIQKLIAITSQKAVFVACKLQGVTMRQDPGYKAKQILELKQGTIVDGPIVFESGKGEVHLYSGAQVLGGVTGGKIIKKILMSELNPEQAFAVQHAEGPLLVLASAGSGKTRVVTYRIARLIDLGVLPSDILAVTFTNKAAGEMRSRIQTLKNAQVLACTFHSLGARILRESITALGYRSDFTIYDADDSDKLLKTCFAQLGFAAEKGLFRQIRQQISAAKNDLLSPEEIDSRDRLFQGAYECYQQKLKECNALDFDDLLYLTVKLLRENEHARKEYQNRWLFVLIDEYQDTNLAQYSLAKLLVEIHRNLFAVGDPDQSIYSWRGARYQNILNFETDFPGAKIVTLDQNYRSTHHILQAANALIQHNQKRFEKQLWSNLGEGEKIGLYVGQNDRQEAEFIAKRILRHASKDQVPFEHIAVFYRTNAQSRTFEDALLAYNIPYVLIGAVSFYERREIKDLLAFLRMIVSDSDLISFLRTVNLPKRGVGAATLEKLAAAATERSLPIFALCEEALHRSDLVKLSPKQRSGLEGYLQLIRKLRSLRPRLKIHELLSETIAESRYLQLLQEEPDTLEDRKENLNELIAKAAEWEEEQEDPSLPQFLEELSLRTPAERSDSLSSVKLMTLHNSKGLEFHTVFLAGLEEDLFPHVNCKDSPEALEEERRLCYVGVTRAKRNLYLTAATYRYLHGFPRFMQLSRFLKEIPPEHISKLTY